MSGTDHDKVRSWQELRLIGPDELTISLACSLLYNRRDPYAVRLSLGTGTSKPVEWTFGRDLLSAALNAAEGIGDVRAWPSPAGAAEKTLHIEIGPPNECARFEVRAAGIKRFLDKTYELVPTGQESAFLNLDAEIAAFLSQA
jgi:Streptomyces sporulation and cell division protein, SsgA